MTRPPGLAQTDAAAVDGLDGLAGWVADLIEALGPVGVGVLVFLESLFPPLPSEAVLPAAGYLSSVGDLGFWSTFTCATVGSVLGSCVLYFIGAAIGQERIRRVAGKIPLIDTSDIDAAWAGFHKWRGWAVMIGRLLPGVRAFISIPAGADGMPLWRFMVLTTIGSGGWNFALMGIGWIFGDQFGSTQTVSTWLNIGLLALAIIPTAIFVNKRRKARHVLRAG
ncbi:MAG: DedA family protein [Actinomycetota bacterium]